MVVITLTNCPMALRGDISKWLMEVSQGVYCGNISAKVRDELWKRLCENIKDGQAVMVYNASGEQHLDIRLHNSHWEIVDYDGIKLIRHPSPKRRKDKEVISGKKKESLTAVEIQKRNKYINRKKREAYNSKNYCVIDLETTGRSIDDDCIIEIGLIKVRNEKIEASFECLVNNECIIPKEIEKLTGISTQMLRSEGITLEQAVLKALEFIGEDILVGYNIRFDYSFLLMAIQKTGIKSIRNRQIDVMSIAKKYIDDINDYKLATVTDYLNVEHYENHRALADCITTHRVYTKLKELQILADN